MMCVCVSSFRFAVHENARFISRSSKITGDFFKSGKAYTMQKKTSLKIIVFLNNFFFFLGRRRLPFFHLSKGSCDCECERLWTSMIMKLMNTYRRFPFISVPKCKRTDSKSSPMRWVHGRDREEKRKNIVFFAMFATNLTTESCQ